MNTKTELKYLIPFKKIEDNFPELNFETKSKILEFVNNAISSTREKTLEEVEDSIWKIKNS